MIISTDSSSQPLSYTLLIGGNSSSERLELGTTNPGQVLLSVVENCGDNTEFKIPIINK